VIEGESSGGGNGKADSGFDADVAISTGELRKLIKDLLEALGGVLEADATTPTAAPAAQPVTPATPLVTATQKDSPPWAIATA
jgi:recombination associated protein RdgC